MEISAYYICYLKYKLNIEIINGIMDNLFTYGKNRYLLGASMTNLIEDKLGEYMSKQYNLSSLPNYILVMLCYSTTI